MTGEPRQPVDTRTLALVAFSATGGAFIEYYDFIIYGYAAASAFPAIFFPRLPPTQALLFSFLAFGAGFPARLLGAFLFGHFGDRIGRKFTFVVNLIIVGAATCLTGLLPGYAKLGIAAPILLVVLRILQGVGIGGEFGGASSLIGEFAAQRRRRAFWMSLATLGVPLGSIGAAVVLLIMSKTFATTGWRVAMLLSVVMVIPALLARYKLADSPLFEQLKQTGKLDALPSFGVLKHHTRPVILLALVYAFQNMGAYVAGTYLISFMRFAGISLATTATILLIGRFGSLLGILASGPTADFCKRRVTAYIGIGLTTLLSYPLTLAVLSKRITLVTLLEILVNFINLGILLGLAPILTNESFPTKFRYSGAGISFNFAGILGGMIAPSLLTGLIGKDVFHKWYYIPIVYGIYAVVAMIALRFIQETRDLKLEDLDRAEPALRTVRT
ncbi:putative MFS family arabinose efflux permease [Edaphobacter aggregans]|uniref:Putative MFS family arabinose efflux permease n=1 Tax=Edaphobacter aggregans TaxID=570835 RepID=A0A428MK75_9BACT|nr:MFS transporter [Edaphobacter aggregans]RSL17219.1 putative MFS family arabinose efflux permease [Edaphobacter aggregans]